MIRGKRKKKQKKKELNHWRRLLEFHPQRWPQWVEFQWFNKSLKNHQEMKMILILWLWENQLQCKGMKVNHFIDLISINNII